VATLANEFCWDAIASSFQAFNEPPQHGQHQQ
jgi:hypothetical protein